MRARDVDGRQTRRGAADEGARHGGHALGIEIERLRVGVAGVRRLAAAHPVGGGAGEAEGGRVGRGKGVLRVRFGPGDARRPRVGRVAAAPAFAGGGQHGIDIDQVPQLAGPAVGHGGAEHAAVAVHDEDAVVEFLGVQRAQHVGDVGFQVDGGREQVGALAHACQRDGVRAVAGADQRVQRVAPVPRAAPGAVNEQVMGHGGLLGQG